MKLIVKIKDAELRAKVLAFYPEAEEAIAEDLQFWLTYGDKRLRTAVTISGGNRPRAVQGRKRRNPVILLASVFADSWSR